MFAGSHRGAIGGSTINKEAEQREARGETERKRNNRKKPPKHKTRQKKKIGYRPSLVRYCRLLFCSVLCCVVFCKGLPSRVIREAKYRPIRRVLSLAKGGERSKSHSRGSQEGQQTRKPS